MVHYPLSKRLERRGRRRQGEEPPRYRPPDGRLGERGQRNHILEHQLPRSHSRETRLAMHRSMMPLTGLPNRVCSG